MNYIKKTYILLFFFIDTIAFSNTQIDAVSLQLNWKYQYEYAGFIMAKEKGFYTKAGFDVELLEFESDTEMVKDMLNAKTTFIISDRLFMIERQKEKVVFLANYLKQSPLVIATNPDIQHPEQLKTKRFMTSEKRIIHTPIDFMFKHLGIPYNMISFQENSYDIENLINQTTDAMVIYKTNEVYRLQQAKVPYSLIEPKDYGFNAGAVNLITTQENIDKYGEEKIKAFINASNEGWKYAFKHEKETLQTLYTHYNNSLKKSQEALQFEAKEIKKLFQLDQFAIGEINKNEFYRWFDILNNYGLIEKQNIYNDFLFGMPWRERVYSEVEIYNAITFIILIIIILIGIIYVIKLKAANLQKKHQEILEEKKIFKRLFNDASDGILIVKEEQIIDANKAALAMLLMKQKKELLQRHIYTLSPIFQADGQTSTTKGKKFLQETQEKGSSHFEWLYKKVDGTEFWVDVTLTSMILNGENIIHTLWRDISVHKKIEAQLIQKDTQLLEQSKMAAMGEMIGNIAHQWRQPLSVISTGATGMKMQKEFGVLNDELFFETCDTINDNAQYLSRTIDDFRNFIKGDSIKAVFCVEKVIHSFLHLVESSIKTTQIKIVLDLENTLEINGYENELIQCFMNIFNNSKDALLQRNVDKKYIYISTYRESNLKNHPCAYISFKDNAGGISPDIISKIFEPYFTTKAQDQGTGIGLQMTYNLIVNNMDGKVTAHNTFCVIDAQKYNGTELLIELPLFQKESVS